MENYSAVYNHVADDASLSSESFFMSTNYTMSNLPGTGRILDKLYRAGGRKVERCLGRLAQRAGYGPDAVSLKIRQIAWDLSYSSGTGRQSTKVQKALSELCRRLLHYAQSPLESTQVRAIANIENLVRWEPGLCGIFRQHNAALFLHFAGRDVQRTVHPHSTSLSELGTLMDTTHALEWTLAANDDLIEFGSTVLSPGEQLSSTRDDAASKREGTLLSPRQKSDWLRAFRSLLNYLKSQETASLALQYFYWWSYGVERGVAVFDFSSSLELASTLVTVLSYDNLYHATDPHYLEITARRVLSRLTFDFAFLKQQCRKDDLDDVFEIDGAVLHVPSVTHIVEDLGRTLNCRRLLNHTDISVRCFEQKSQIARSKQL